jgi:pyridinium-3,5-bisthiocarboxylic acid mononucleotide nickel chelatase
VNRPDGEGAARSRDAEGASARHAWIDATAGIAGDMLLGALIDAGAPVAKVQQAVDAVIPASVVLDSSTVSRAGQRATRIEVRVITPGVPERSWSAIRALILAADLADTVRERALSTFDLLAAAEARVHGIPAEAVHFHEVGALDSIADIVGVCAALHELGIGSLSASTVAVGSGRMRSAHGDLGIPVPAVVQLATRWRIVAGGTGELTTPTGMALVAALCETCEDLPLLELQTAGAGAGSRDIPGRPNLTRVLIGARQPYDGIDDRAEPAVVLEANVDDFDPRLWPGVLSRLVDAGAADAWLVPILMKKGRPAHTLAVLARPDQAARLREEVLRQTSSFGVRQTDVARSALPRGWVDVTVDGARLPIKIAHRNGVIWQATPEFDDVDRLAAERAIPRAALLHAASAAAAAAGLVSGAPIPTDLRPERG